MDDQQLAAIEQKLESVGIDASSSTTPLTKAIMAGEFDIARQLIDKGYDPFKGYPEAFNFLATHGPNVGLSYTDKGENTRRFYGTVIGLNRGDRPRYAKARTALLKQIIDLPDFKEKFSGSYNRTESFQALAEHDLDRNGCNKGGIFYELYEKGIDVFAPDYSGKTIVHCLAEAKPTDLNRRPELGNRLYSLLNFAKERLIDLEADDQEHLLKDFYSSRDENNDDALTAMLKAAYRHKKQYPELSEQLMRYAVLNLGPRVDLQHEAKNTLYRTNTNNPRVNAINLVSLLGHEDRAIELEAVQQES